MEEEAGPGRGNGGDMDRPIVTLTTDFGNADGFPAAMKAVILSSCPAARIVDVTHEVPPHNVAHASFVLGQVAPYFPDGTVHVVAVDPGVGSAREAVALRSPNGSLFIGPDNGVFTHVLAQDLPAEAFSPDEDFLGPLSDRVPPGWRAVDIKNGPRIPWKPSQTFHGRDIFAPTAARVVEGVDMTVLGSEIRDLVVLNLPLPEHKADGIHGLIQYIDRFGNMATNLRGDQLPRVVRGVKLQDRVIPGPFSSYQQASGVGCIIASHGYLEVFVTEGNAAAELNANVGDPVTALI